MKKKKLIMKRVSSIQELNNLFSELEKELSDKAILRAEITVDYHEAGISPLRVRFAQKRAAMFISQLELSRRIGITQSSLSKFESGVSDIGLYQFERARYELRLMFKSAELTGQEAHGLDVHQFFKKVRAKKNLTQTDLSILSGVTSCMISHFEKGGKISITSLEKLMKVLEIVLL